MAPPQRKFLRTEHGERVDHEDFEFASATSQFRQMMQFVSGVIVGDDRTRASADPTDVAQSKHAVLKGFAVTNPNDQDVRIEGGVAISGMEDEGVPRYGSLVTDGGSKTQDISAFTLQTVEHGIYVRMVFLDDDVTNRVFCNSAESPPVELARSIATRLTENWEFKIAVSNPGDEWMQIASVVPGDLLGDGSNTGITDRRNFMFEGRADAGTPYILDDTDWGHATDRTLGNTRATNGVFGFRRFTKGVLRQIQDIIGAGGSNGWFAEIPESGNLTDLETNRLHRSGRSAANNRGFMTGGFDPLTDDSHDMGDDTTPRRWGDIFGRGIGLGTSRLDTAVNALLGRIKVPASNTFARTLIFESHRDDALKGSQGTNRIYRTRAASGGSLTSDGVEYTFNCSWDGSQWTRDAAAPATMLSLNSTGLIIYEHASALASSWADTVAAATWTQSHSLGISSGVLSTLTVRDAFSAAYMIATSALGKTVAPNANTVYANNQVKAWGEISWTAGPVVTLVEGFNVDVSGIVAGASNTKILIPFLRDMPHASYFAMGQHTNGVLQQSRTPVFDRLVGSVQFDISVDLTTTASTMTFAVIG